MNKSTREEVRELAHALRLHLLEECGEGKHISCSQEQYKALAVLARPRSPHPSTPSQPANSPKAPALTAAKTVAKPAQKPPSPVKKNPAEKKSKEEKPKSRSPQGFSLEKAPVADDEMAELRQELKRLFPQVSFSEVPLDDSLAKENAERWKKRRQQWEVLLISPSDAPKQQNFLYNVSQAINRILAPAGCVTIQTVLQKETLQRLLSSPSLRLVIAPLHLLNTQEEMQAALKSDPPRLGNMTLIDTGDLKDYAEEPAKKATLWKHICEQLGSPEAAL